MSPSWLGFTVTHLWKHDLYPLCFSLSRSWSSVASTGRWIKLQVKRSLFSSSSNVSLRTVQLFPLFPCPPVSCSSDAALCTAPLCLCTYMSPCTSRSASPPILHARKLHSHAHSDKLMMARGEWVGGHEPKTAHCILTEWGIKSSLSFSISSAEMQSLDSSVTVLQGFENITRA